MDPKRALIIACVAFALAIAVIAVDIEMGVEVELESKIDGEWRTVSHSEVGFSRGFDPYLRCASPELRVVIENDLLWSVSERLVVRHDDGTLGGDIIFDDIVTVDGRDHHIFEFTVDVPDGNMTSDEKFVYNQINIQYGEIYLGTCLEAA